MDRRTRRRVERVQEEIRRLEQLSARTRAQMRTSADRLRFLVRLAGAPLDGDGLDTDLLRWDLGAFLGVTGPDLPHRVRDGQILSVLEPPYPWSYPLAGLRELQQDAGRMIGQAIDGSRVWAVLQTSSPVLLAVRPGPKGRRALDVSGPVPACFRLVAAFALLADDASRLRRCLDPACGRIFLRERGQVGCSIRCTRRIYMRQYRAADTPVAKSLQKEKARREPPGRK